MYSNGFFVSSLILTGNQDIEKILDLELLSNIQMSEIVSLFAVAVLKHAIAKNAYSLVPLIRNFSLVTSLEVAWKIWTLTHSAIAIYDAKKNKNQVPGELYGVL